MNVSDEIALELEARIRRGELTGKLPSEKDMAAQFSVAGMTVSRAMDILKAKGLVRPVPRRGTFVVPPERKVLRIYGGASYFAMKHPELLLAGMRDVELVGVRSLAEADIAVFATTMAMNYSSHFLPWPAQIVREFRESGNFYPQVFEFHHIGMPVYAVAYNFCPILLRYNRKLMREFCPDFSPCEFTYEELVRLAARIPEKHLPGARNANRILFSLAYACGSLHRALPEFRRFKTAEGESGRPEDCIFMEIIRERLERYPVDRDFGLMPMPEIRGERFCHAASEAIFVPIHSRYPEIAFQLAANSLSPGFQQAVADSRTNIPAIRKIAASSRKGGEEGLFFDEIRHIHYPREIIDPVSAAVILDGLKKLAGQGITPDEFFALLQEEEAFVKRREDAIKSILSGKYDF